MNWLTDWLSARLKEPSTHVAVATALWGLTPLIPQPYGMVAAAVFTALGFGMPEK